MFSYFKFKDIFTLANLFLSFFAVILIFDGKVEVASYILLINILILDILDGLVARLTKTGNEFGKQFDSVVDFVGSSVMMSYLVFVALSKINFYVALGCGFLLVFVGVMREVRSRIETVSCKGFFVGLPRNAAMLLLVTMLNSDVFGFFPWMAVFCVVLLSYYQLSHVPFVGNDKPMLLAIPRMKIYLMTAVVLIGIQACMGLFWDGVFAILSCYLLTPYVLVDRAVWEDIRAQVGKGSLS